MSDERDQWGFFIDPGTAYQHFMLGLFDLSAEAADGGYSQEARELLEKARLMFMDEFQAKYPGYGKGRALWR